MQVNDEIKSALGPLAGRDSMYFDVNETTLTLLKLGQNLLYISCYEREVHVFEVKVIYQMSKMGIRCNFFVWLKRTGLNLWLVPVCIRSNVSLKVVFQLQAYI